MQTTPDRGRAEEQYAAARPLYEPPVDAPAPAEPIPAGMPDFAPPPGTPNSTPLPGPALLDPALPGPAHRDAGPPGPWLPPTSGPVTPPIPPPVPHPRPALHRTALVAVLVFALLVLAGIVVSYTQGWLPASRYVPTPCTAPTSGDAYDVSNGLVSAGGLTYPVAGGPYECPKTYTEAPFLFLTDVVEQTTPWTGDPRPTITIGTVVDKYQSLAPDLMAAGIAKGETADLGIAFCGNKATQKEKSSDAISLGGYYGWRLVTTVSCAGTSEITVIVMDIDGTRSAFVSNVPAGAVRAAKLEAAAALAGLTAG